MADVQDKFGVVHSADRDERMEGGHRGRGRPGMDDDIMFSGRGPAGRGGPRGFMSDMMGTLGFGMNMG